MHSSASMKHVSGTERLEAHDGLKLRIYPRWILNGDCRDHRDCYTIYLYKNKRNDSCAPVSSDKFASWTARQMSGWMSWISWESITWIARCTESPVAPEKGTCLLAFTSLSGQARATNTIHQFFEWWAVHHLKMWCMNMHQHQIQHLHNNIMVRVFCSDLALGLRANIGIPMTWLYDAAAKLQTFPPNIGACLRKFSKCSIDFIGNQISAVFDTHTHTCVCLFVVCLSVSLSLSTAFLTQARFEVTARQQNLCSDFSLRSWGA